MLRQVLIVEDHPICVSALTAALHAVDSAIMVTAVDSLQAAQDTLATLRPAAVLLDLGLPDSTGLVNLAAIQAQARACPVLVVSGNDEPAIMAQARALGAAGFLSKTAPLSRMRDAIGRVLDGGSVFPDDLPAVGSGEAEQSAFGRLSPAQIKVLIELGRGHSNKIIAYNLDLSEATVKSHLSTIFKALGVTNRSQAILALQNTGEASAA